MPGPQRENYTQIANEILEAVARLAINATQFRILLVVWRYTYGFHRKQHKLSTTFIARATGIHRKQVTRELSKLINRKILIEVEKPSFNSSRVIAFNKHYESYQGANPLTGSGLVDPTGSGLVDPTGSESAPQERKVLKKVLKEKSDPKFSPDSEPIKAALYLRDLIKKNHPRQPLPPEDPDSEKLQKWAASLDQLHRLGPPGGDKGYSWTEIKSLIDFSQADPFWQGNILSASKFREKIINLESQYRRAGSKPKGGSSSYNQNKPIEQWTKEEREAAGI